MCCGVGVCVCGMAGFPCGRSMCSWHILACPIPQMDSRIPQAHPPIPQAHTPILDTSNTRLIHISIPHTHPSHGQTGMQG